ncbi:MAG: TIGR04255 family protein [Thermodesulfobacteriota bacterium]|nr:TIGR04255 family protein [Thermodesulfobacteriota bacterium]
MAKIRYLKNAPITEAIIDFRIKPPSGIQVSDFLPLTKTLQDQYPKVKDIRKFEGRFDFDMKKGKALKSSLEETPQGYRCESDDEKNIVQFKIDGLTFSRLKPYTRWEDIFAEARRIWDIYITKISTASVMRLATRYINHIEIPLPIDFSQYLTAPPIIPNDLPQSATDFLTRIVVHDTNLDILVNITQALGKSSKKNHAAIILDIDAYKQCELDVNSEDMWLIFGQLHDMKNKIFFGSITEKTAGLFE